jgi:16S rRNA (adenine1518-N6/adenine1519-N6)-dimethyltransferase
VVVETVVGAASIRAWCVMVQREVAERLFAEPGTKAYGAVSVLVRLHARRTGFHPVSRTVFRPPPNVDSALVAFERVAAPENADRVRRVVTGSFAHRRKTLANSLALAGVAPRGAGVDALAAIGRAADVRAEALAPEEFVRLSEELPDA